MLASPTQQAIIDARDTNIMVSASAGSGKTTVLVSRLCDLVIKDKISIDRILAMTFTEAAAAEMKTRLKKQLQQQDQNDPWIARQLSLLENAAFSTIHGFCLDLVQTWYYQIPLSYSMAHHVETGMQDKMALMKAYEQAKDSLLPEDFAALSLYMQAFGKNDEDLQDLILKFLETAFAKPDPEAWMNACLQEIKEADHWFFDYFASRTRILVSIMERMIANVQEQDFAREAKRQEWITLFERKKEYLQRALDSLKQKDYAAFRKGFMDYLQQTGRFTPTINKIKYDSLQKSSKSLEKEIFENLYPAEDFACWTQEAKPLKETFIELARRTRHAFAKAKEAMGFIDFNDMEQFAWTLMQKEEVAKAVQDAYDVILVDEYQDTNDLQEAIISKAARDNNVFRVGDVKQSIYGFRHAKPELMRSLMEKKDQNNQPMVMDENFRSSAALIDFTNRFFSTLMNVEGMPGQFTAADAAKPGTDTQKEGPQNPVRFLYTLYGGWTAEEEDKSNDILARKVHKANRADQIAHDIQQKLKEGYDYRDIAILSRTSTPHKALKEGLEAWGIPVISRTKQGFYTNQAVQVIIAVLSALVSPRNDIAMMAMLCSPIGGATQAQVAAAAAGRPDGQSLFDALRTDPLMKSWRILEKKKSLPLGELITEIYKFNDFYERYTTAVDKTNLDLFLEKASQAEQDMSLEEFTELVMQEQDFNETGEALPYGREANVVKITTIHSSKGLQYPIVYVLCEEKNTDMEAGNPILIDPDLGLSLRHLSDSRHVSCRSKSDLAFRQHRFLEDQQEKMRLFYVACTRAEKELVFVDTLKNLEDYQGGMNLEAIWSNKGFTGWAARIFQADPNPLYKMEEHDLLERPNNAKRRNHYIKTGRYSLPVQEIHSRTASQQEKFLKWSRISLTGSKGKERGTLLHNLAAHLPYPYKAKAASEYAARFGMELEQGDLQQFLSLNTNPTFAYWMSLPHTFEAPYNVFIDGAYQHGYMDLLVEDGDTIHILDFKSDAVFDMKRLVDVYSDQLAAYQKAVQKIAPGKTVRIYLYSFFLKELHELSLQDIADAGKPAESDLETAQPAKREVPKPQMVKNEAAKSQTAENKAAKSQMAKSEAAKSQMAKSEAANRLTAKAETADHAPINAAFAKSKAPNDQTGKSKRNKEQVPLSNSKPAAKPDAQSAVQPHEEAMSEPPVLDEAFCPSSEDEAFLDSLRADLF